MPRLSYVFAATLLGAASLAQPAAAQEDFTTATFGGTTIWAGGGVAFLSLPDIRFVGKGSSPGDIVHQKNSDFGEYGGTAGGGIETALGYWGNMRVTGGIKGFWAGIEDSQHSACASGTCFVFDPADGDIFAFGPPKLRTKTDREADYWGGQAELKFAHGEPTQVKPNFYRNDYFILGFDVRGIDQDNQLRGNFRGLDVYTYNETLETTYYGGYIGFGGEYSFGFIPGIKNVGGLYDRLGLRTFVNVKAGLYDAQTDYSGAIVYPFLSGATSRITQSDDDLAFIGSVSLETRKQIGPRTSLSLWTDYEYISSAPKMIYADTSRSTQIDEESIFATRTMLRLNIGLGSQQLYPEQ